MHTRRWLGFCLVLLVTTGARAQVTPAEKAAAEALFDRGMTATREGKFDDACRAFEQSQAIERGIGTMLWLADCYERTGRTASAWALFREASSEARANGQGERAEAGRQRAERLEPMLGRLIIEVPADGRASGLEVLRNGAPVPPGLWGVGVPVDPGAHKIEARAPGHQSYTQSIGIEKGPGAWKVEVPKLVAEAQPVAAAPAVTSVAEPTPVAAPAPIAPKEKPGKAQRIAGIVMGSAGVALLAVGGGFGIRAIRKNNETKDLCGDDNPCGNAKGVDASKSAKTAATLSTAGLAGGGALLAGGLLTYLLAPKGDAQISLGVGERTALLSVGGVF
ncbi:MAG: hypothetical protein ABW252_05010 [Polyangiales bacterium]